MQELFQQFLEENIGKTMRNYYLFYSYIHVCGGICQNIRICYILSVIC